MLFLQLPADAAAPAPPPVPLADSTALAFERALLSRDPAARLSELTAALAADRNAAAWAMRMAELKCGRTINRVEEAAGWLCSRLVVELEAALTTDFADTFGNAIDWRLPALVSALAAGERQAADFECRLEREKLQSLKELAYGASHEINNPLANIAARAQTLLEDEPDPKRRRRLEAIHRQAMRAHEMIADLMLFARPPKLRRAPCNLESIVERVIDELRELSGVNDVELIFNHREAKPIQLDADETQLSVAVAAIVKNAIEASNSGESVHVNVQRISLADKWLAEVLVSDDGPGISEEVRRHMFDPFFSGREAGRGLGFGASKAWRIVTDHGGQVVVGRPSHGAEIAIQLPI
jgi:signal transduction histidine kinase